MLRLVFKLNHQGASGDELWAGDPKPIRKSTPQCSGPGVPRNFASSSLSPDERALGIKTRRLADTFPLKWWRTQAIGHRILQDHLPIGAYYVIVVTSEIERAGCVTPFALHFVAIHVPEFALALWSFVILASEFEAGRSPGGSPGLTLEMESR